MIIHKQYKVKRLLLLQLNSQVPEEEYQKTLQNESKQPSPNRRTRLKRVGLPIASRTDCLTIFHCAPDLLLIDLSRDFNALPFRRV
jgi:hypothetical protein